MFRWFKILNWSEKSLVFRPKKAKLFWAIIEEEEEESSLLVIAHVHYNEICPLHLTHPLQGAVGCHCAAPGEHSGAKGLAQGPRVVICGIRTRPLVSPLEHKPPVLTTRPPLPSSARARSFGHRFRSAFPCGSLL
ncbi:hypothetical protein GOODEAATRI_022376 [Goodea atripinnis]|uniref:Uncharacterized protein n=1 Tax=Goodea atripinnis TaxID=208336 RepID=A0ABV0MUX7_9TELE